MASAASAPSCRINSSGTPMANFLCRVLCLKMRMPISAPNAENGTADHSSAVSGIRQSFRFAFRLSMPKRMAENRFKSATAAASMPKCSLRKSAIVSMVIAFQAASLPLSFGSIAQRKARAQGFAWMDKR